MKKKILISFLVLICAFQVSALVLTDSFETGYYNITAWSGNETNASWTLTYNNTIPAALGSYYAVFHSNSSDDPLVNGAYRSELKLFFENQSLAATNQTEFWVGFSTYTRSQQINNYSTLDPFAIIAQFPRYPDLSIGEPYISPIIAVEIRNNSGTMNYTIVTRYCFLRNNTNSDNINITYSLPFEFNEWNDFVIHVNFSITGGGLLQVWKDGALSINYSGHIGYNDTYSPYYKNGLYKSGYLNFPITTYLDDVKIGNYTSSYSEVAPTDNPVIIPSNKINLNGKINLQPGGKIYLK